MDYKHNSFTIIGGKYLHGNISHMDYGTHFIINIINNSHTRCLVNLFIDDKDMGNFLITPYNTIQVDRSVYNNKLFTFYRTDLLNSKEKHGPGKYINGFIKIIFTPEKLNGKKIYLTKPIYIKNPYNPVTYIETTIPLQLNHCKQTIMSYNIINTNDNSINDTINNQ